MIHTLNEIKAYGKKPKKYKGGGGFEWENEKTGAGIQAGGAAVAGAVDALDQPNKWGNQSTAGTIMKQAGSFTSAGAAFGPIGAAAGAVLGTAIGAVQAARQRKEEREAQRKAALAGVTAGQQKTAARLTADPTLVYGKQDVSYFMKNGGALYGAYKLAKGGPLTPGEPVVPDQYKANTASVPVTPPRQLETPFQVSTDTPVPQHLNKFVKDNNYTHVNTYISPEGYVVNPDDAEEYKNLKPYTIPVDDYRRAVNKGMTLNQRAYQPGTAGLPTAKRVRGTQYGTAVTSKEGFDAVRFDQNMPTYARGGHLDENGFPPHQFGSVMEIYQQAPEELKKGGGIHIKPENRGKFTAAAKRAGMGVQEYARHVLANKEKHSSTLVKRANFARNASKWKHEDGGPLEPQEGLVIEAEGGQMRPMSSDTAEVKGPSHKGGGVYLPDYHAEVEGGETIADDYVFSKALGFAPIHKRIAKAKGLIEAKPMSAARQNSLKLLDLQEERLKAAQENYKAQYNMGGDLSYRANGGPVEKKYRSR